MKSRINSHYIKYDCKRICQGDILRDFDYPSWVSITLNLDGKKIAKVSKIKFPYVVILSQECDLEKDFENRSILNQNLGEVEDLDQEAKQDKYIPSILLCPAYLAESLKEGKHLAELHLKMDRKNKDKWADIKNNEVPRYHYLQNDASLQIPLLTIDFKHYFTIPRDELYKVFKDHYIGTVNELFREALSQRFAFYLSRIGLPELENRLHNS